VKYIVAIAGREIEVEVDGDQVTVAGRVVPAGLATVAGTPLRQLTLDDRVEAAAVERLGNGRWAVTRLGERHEIEVLDERARHIRGLTAGGDRPRGPAVLRAPMPGLVVRVQVEAGQTVAAGAGLVVLEAMKMENELRAAVAGVVRMVRIAPGAAVEKGEVLVEFDPSP
jgi:biotin carboxyl carrier protein